MFTLAYPGLAEEKRQKNRKRPRVYYQKQDGKVHGRADLALTADYTAQFAQALLKIWMAAFEK